MTLTSRLAPAAVNRQFPGHMVSLVLRGAIRLYQLTLAYFFVGACRFEPSCSAYAADAVARHGALKGTLLAAGRLCRCGPWTSGGYDPVPPRGVPSSLSCHSAERP
jgi:putative membrane protein insertion efficiency factor